MNIDVLNNILDLESYTSTHAWPKHSYEMAFRKHWRVVGAYESDSLLGVIVYQMLFEQCTLMNLVVSSTSLKQGVATELIATMFKDAKVNNCDSVFLEVRSDNKSAVSLYQKVGFEIVNTRYGYYRYNNQSLDAYEMAIHLFS